VILVLNLAVRCHFFPRVPQLPSQLQGLAAFRPVPGYTACDRGTRVLITWPSLLYSGTPGYLADECTLVTVAVHCTLRSADNRTCLVKRSLNQFGDRCFAIAGPTLWNSLPEQLRQPASPSDCSNDR